MARIPYKTDETVSPEGKREWERMQAARGGPHGGRERLSRATGR